MTFPIWIISWETDSATAAKDRGINNFRYVADAASIRVNIFL